MNDDRARQPPVRRYWLRNLAGVMPAVSLKSRNLLAKWLGESAAMVTSWTGVRPFTKSLRRCET